MSALAESLRVSMVKCVVLTRTVNCNAIWIIDSLLVPSQWLCKWNVPGARLSEIHPGGFISLIRFSLVISYANTLAPGDMGTQPSSGDQDIYIIQILLREVGGAETLPPALQILLPPARIYPPSLLVSPPVSSIVSWFSNLIVPVTPRAGPNSPNSRHSCAACCCLSNVQSARIYNSTESRRFKVFLVEMQYANTSRTWCEIDRFLAEHWHCLAEILMCCSFYHSLTWENGRTQNTKSRMQNSHPYPLTQGVMEDCDTTGLHG